MKYTKLTKIGYVRQVVVKYDAQLSPSFKSKLSKFIRENKPDEFKFSLHVEEVQPHRRGVGLLLEMQ